MSRFSSLAKSKRYRRGIEMEDDTSQETNHTHHTHVQCVLFPTYNSQHVSIYYYIKGLHGQVTQRTIIARGHFGRRSHEF